MEWIESANVFNALNKCRNKTNAALVKYLVAELSVQSLLKVLLVLLNSFASCISRNPCIVIQGGV